MIYYLYPYEPDPHYSKLDYYCIFDHDKAIAVNLFGKDYYFYDRF